MSSNDSSPINSNPVNNDSLSTPSSSHQSNDHSISAVLKEAATSSTRKTDDLQAHLVADSITQKQRTMAQVQAASVT
ncbi:MAG: hypothetical protein Q4P13_03185, partial [Psychrobacter sp.]|nr:hypothetical protein [Psychrobacter sp.]